MAIDPKSLVSGITVLPDRTERLKKEALGLQREELDLQRQKLAQDRLNTYRTEAQKAMTEAQKQVTDLLNLNYAKATLPYDRKEIIADYDALTTEVMNTFRENVKMRGPAGAPLDMSQIAYFQKKANEIDGKITMAEFNATNYGKRVQDFAGLGGDASKIDVEGAKGIWAQAEKELFNNQNAKISDRYSFLSAATPPLKREIWAPADIFKTANANIRAESKQVASSKYPGKQDIVYDKERTYVNLYSFFSSNSPAALEWKKKLKDQYGDQVTGSDGEVSHQTAASYFAEHGQNAMTDRFAGQGVVVNNIMDQGLGSPTVPPGGDTASGVDKIPAKIFYGENDPRAVTNPEDVGFSYDVGVSVPNKPVRMVMSGDDFIPSTGKGISAGRRGETPESNVDISQVRYYRTRHGKRIPDSDKTESGVVKLPYFYGRGKVKDRAGDDVSETVAYRATVENLRNYFNTVYGEGGANAKFLARNLKLWAKNKSTQRWDVIPKEKVEEYINSNGYDWLLKTISTGGIKMGL